MGRFLPELVTLDRKEFLSDYWDYKPGEHVTILGPTGSGKTFLQNQLVKHSAHEKLPALMLIAKPRDETVKQWNKQLKYPVVHDWPAPMSKRLVNPKAPGWIIWPKHKFDPDKDNIWLKEVFRRALLDSYKRGDRILLADETFGLASELKLGNELVTIWSRGRSMGTGLWAGTQKPTHIPLWAYSQAEHLFLAKDPDARARDRYDEIGGIDPHIVEHAVMGLGKRQFLYIKRDGPTLCRLTE